MKGTKKDVEEIIKEVKTMKIKYCIWCGVAKDTAELHNIPCKKTRNLLGIKVNRHAFFVSPIKQ